MWIEVNLFYKHNCKLLPMLSLIKNQHSLNDYKYYGKWVGNATLDENCTNPEVLYESIQ